MLVVHALDRLDRFARDLSVQMQLLAYLISKGLTLISASTGDDVTAAVADEALSSVGIATP